MVQKHGAERSPEYLFICLVVGRKRFGAGVSLYPSNRAAQLYKVGNSAFRGADNPAFERVNNGGSFWSAGRYLGVCFPMCLRFLTHFLEVLCSL